MRTRIITAVIGALIFGLTAAAALTQTPAKDGGTRPIIKERPEPTWPKSINKSADLTIVLHALFRADGTVTDITRYRVVPEQPSGLSAQDIDTLARCAIEAAAKISFTPATRSGHSVSIWMELQYDFKREDNATATRSEEKRSELSSAKSSTSIGDQPLLMSYAPDPKLPADLDLKIELAVTLKVEFKQDGKVGKVEVISSRVPASMSAKMLARLEEATADAARRIRFTPAVKDGHRLSQWYLLEYTFRRGKQQRYSNWRQELIA